MNKHTARLACIALASSLSAGAAQAADPLEQGKTIAFDRKRGNCLACHMMEGGQAPGNIGPPLIAMKARYPERAKLRAQIWDATARNPLTSMPPFGKHGILTEKELDMVVDFVRSL